MSGTGPSAHKLQAPQGALAFETEDGEPHHISAEKLSSLLREHAVPAAEEPALEPEIAEPETEPAEAGDEGEEEETA